MFLARSHLTQTFTQFRRFTIQNTTSGFPVAQTVKDPPAVRETQVRSVGGEDSLEEAMAAHSSVLAWRIPWTEGPGGLQSLGSRRVRQD